MLFDVPNGAAANADPPAEPESRWPEIVVTTLGASIAVVVASFLAVLMYLA